MGELNIFISNPAKLSIKSKNLNIKSLESSEAESLDSLDSQDSKNAKAPSDEVFIPLDNISSIIVDNPMCIFTHTLLDFLAQKNIVLIVCDDKHLPSGILLSLLNHSKTSLHLRTQIKLNSKTKATLWQEIIKVKIANQAAVLEILGKENSEVLRKMAKKVLLNDSSNLEALAARIYFSSLFSEDFKRSKSDFKRREENIINAMLNYGYAIIRAKIARSICAKGLLPSFGIFHDSSLNAFNLADDFLEVFRGFVDIYAYKYIEFTSRRSKAPPCDEGRCPFETPKASGTIAPRKSISDLLCSPNELNKEDKLYLLGIFKKEIPLNGKMYLFDKGIDEVISQYLRIVLGKDSALKLPLLDTRFCD
ncbi:hypothetical protein CCY99_03260 [Helicobacter sp. 16-1353]|uniref:type II CRISPR-associated endonuclease Cas1 n=1 Tax=Helicobacter sp. 16-1353 TaxID=2004996 RepID=UPI000DCEEEA2|nr:type II CRISPR-associated endonuclease Cas1 [Helicobacter sp. 16-1353]RAX54386.1 hypothetical protein CCY99_03260 [Helicobacter sp. 16-1353]